jgi:hypothetical protein
MDHRARSRLTTSTDSEPLPRARLDEGGPGQSIFGYLVKSRRAPTRTPPPALYAIFDDKRHPYYEAEIAA